MSTCTCLTTYRREDLVLQVTKLIGRVEVDKMIAADFAASDKDHDDIKAFDIMTMIIPFHLQPPVFAGARYRSWRYAVVHLEAGMLVGK